MGHVRDLPRFLRRGDIGVKINGSFRPEYVIPEDKRAVINELAKLAKDADIVYLATDPDREGEGHLLAPGAGPQAAVGPHAQGGLP